MKAVDSKLLALLKVSTQFVVPIYQRVYSWQQPECAQIWSDIIRAGGNDKLGAHFTGSIVYVAKDEGTNTSAEKLRRSENGPGTTGTKSRNVGASLRLFSRRSTRLTEGVWEPRRRP